MIGAQVSVRPNASRNASIPYRSLNWSTIGARRRRRIHGPELVVPVVVARRLLPGEVHHHADEVGDGDAGVAHVVDPPAGAELAADHRTATGDDHRVDGHERRVAVEQRRGREVDVVGGEPGEADDDLREEVQLREGHRDALGRAGRAGRVEDRAEVLGLRRRQRVDVAALELLPGVGRPAVLPEQRDRLVANPTAGVDDPEPLDHPRVLGDGDPPLGLHVVDDRVAGLRDDQLMAQELALVVGVDRHLDEAADRGPPPGADEVGRVLGHEDHTVALSRTRSVERRGHVLGGGERLAVGVGHVLVGEVQAHRVRPLGHVVAQHMVERPRLRVGKGRDEVGVDEGSGRHVAAPAAVGSSSASSMSCRGVIAVIAGTTSRPSRSSVAMVSSAVIVGHCGRSSSGSTGSAVT